MILRQKQILEFWRVGYGFSLSEDDILNGIYFELYSGDLVAHLYKQFVPVDYQYTKFKINNLLNRLQNY